MEPSAPAAVAELREPCSSGAGRVAVIGGGYAGLAAAVELAAHGVAATVFEAAKRPGGRARRVEYRGTVLDNGCHILLGCYRETLRLIARFAGTESRAPSPLLRLGLELVIPGRFHLRSPRLPAPLHTLVGLIACRGLSLREKFTAIRFMRVMARAGFRLAADETVASLLARHRQTGAAADFLWKPLCLAALNTPPEEASAQVFLNVLRDSLHGDRAASDLLLPRVDLSSLFPDPASMYLESAGCSVQLGCAVDAIAPGGGRLIISAGGRDEAYSRVICAVSPHRAAALLAPIPELRAVAATLQALKFQPIYSVYLQYTEGVRLPRPMTGMAGGFGQWAFDRGALCGQPGLVGVVISGPGAHESMSRERLGEEIAGELSAMLPGLPPPRWHWVIAEKRATVASSAGRRHLANETPVAGLYLAGDYTDPEYPATLEAAVRSGVKCARLVLGAT